MDAVFCDYCQTILSGLLIRCEDCSDFDLCLQCFSCGVECGDHKKEHKYRVENVVNSLVFESTCRPWSVIEEHKLLDAVEEYGFGNWTQVAGHVKTRSSEECEEHFCTYYVNGNIGKATFPNEPSGQITDLSCHVGGPVATSEVPPVPPLELSMQEQQALGFMVLRNDFEREYNNSAEAALCGLATNADDDELDAEVKLCCVSKYRLHLHERVRRKRIAGSHRLITTSLVPSKNGKTPNAKRKFPPEEGDDMDKMKVFAQLQTGDEHERLHQVVTEEKELKSKIERLSDLRKEGFTVVRDMQIDVKAKLKPEKCSKGRKRRRRKLSSRKPNSMAKKSEGEVEKLDILIDEDDTKDDEGLQEGSREMACMPGYDGLSKSEKKLCNSLKLLPTTYMKIKSSIVEDFVKRLNGIPAKIRFPSGVDRTHRRQILSFLSDNGSAVVM